MSDPVRWRDPDSGGPAAMRELLTKAPGGTAMSAAARARLAERAAQISASPVGLAGAAKWLGAKGLVTACVVGLAGVIVVVGASSVRRAPTASRAIAAVTTPRPTEVLAMPVAIAARTLPAANEAVEVAPSGVGTAGVPARAINRAPVVAATIALHHAGSNPATPTVVDARDNASREFDLVSSATQALNSADPGLALRRASEAEREFPRGEYIEERDRVAIFALHALHRDAAARTRAEQYLTNHPRGIYAGPVRRLIGSLP